MYKNVNHMPIPPSPQKRNMYGQPSSTDLRIFLNGSPPLLPHDHDIEELHIAPNISDIEYFKLLYKLT